MLQSFTTQLSRNYILMVLGLDFQCSYDVVLEFEKEHLT